MRLAPILLAFLALGCAVPEPPAPLAEAPPTRAAQAPRVPDSPHQIRLSFAPVVKRAAPAVVNIYTRKVVERRLSPFANDPFFREFFGGMFPDMPRRRIENSLGSGVIVDPAGIVVSNHHVVAGADEITVVLPDKREFDARIVFEDEPSDLAVLALDTRDPLPALDLRDSDTLEVGDLVLAIGNPFGVGQTVTSGIVSGLARGGAGRNLREGYFIQTDAAINPGNSGGALVDMEGRLVGVNTAILSRSGGSNGIGFAIPANLVARVIEAARGGEAALERPWLGLEGQTVTGDLADALGLAQPQGVLIGALHPESPLRAAGLESGDVVIRLADQPVDSLSELRFRADTLGTGRAATVAYLRDGRERRGTVRLRAAPDIPARAPISVRRGALRGLEAVTINPAVIEEAGLPVTAEGVLIVAARGLAARRGFRPGDIVHAADGVAIRTTDDLVAAFERARGRLVLEIERDGRRGRLVVGG